MAARRRLTIQLQQHIGLQQVLGAVDLRIGNDRTQAHPFALHVEQHLVALERIANEVDAPQAGVLVARVERLEAVAQLCRTTKHENNKN